MTYTNILDDMKITNKSLEVSSQNLLSPLHKLFSVKLKPPPPLTQECQCVCAARRVPPSTEFATRKRLHKEKEEFRSIFATTVHVLNLRVPSSSTRNTRIFCKPTNTQKKTQMLRYSITKCLLDFWIGFLPYGWCLFSTHNPFCFWRGFLL